MRKIMIGTISILLTLGMTGCNQLPGNQKLPKDVTGKAIDDKFVNGMMDYSFKFFKQAVGKDETIVMSPVSLMIALAMTANGAQGVTQSEMTELFGSGDVNELNNYLLNYVKILTGDQKLALADSLWVKDDGTVEIRAEFEELLKAVYQAEIYKARFDEETVKDINAWVNKNTRGMIPEIIDSINKDTIVCLINALAFEAEWSAPYNLNDVYESIFTTFDDKEQKIEFMFSEEHLYLEDDKVTGFIKPYQDGNFAFVALLPNEDININDYLAQLSGEQVKALITDAKEGTVNCHLPKFTTTSSISLNAILKSLGMVTAFTDEADFGNMLVNSDNALIDEVLQKAFIVVDELGTKAGAATIVSVKVTSIPLDEYTVYLDRPFIYLIIDTSTNLPVFMGTVMSIEQ